MKTAGFLAPSQGTLASIALSLLTACGGGSESEEETQNGAAPGFVLFSGTIADANGTPVSGAQIRLPYGSGAAWGTDSDQNGKFSFQARVSDFAGVSPVAMTIEKEGYRPRAVSYKAITEGVAYPLPSDATTALAALQVGEYSPKINNSIVHLGDDKFSGNVNSQLQLKSIGDGIVTDPFLTWNAELKSKFSKARLEFIARGINQDCTNQIGFLANNGNLLLSQRPSPSAASGDYTTYAIEYSLQNVQPDSSLRFFAKSELCAPNDIDDFEFTSVFVKLVQ